MDIDQETTALIAASKVQGTEVYNSAGESLGSIHDLMIDKVSGNVAYAIMSFGGFLGIGNSYHPLPWSLLQTTRAKGDMSSISTSPNWRELPPMTSASSPIGTIPNTKPKSTTITASARTGARLDRLTRPVPCPERGAWSKQG